MVEQSAVEQTREKVLVALKKLPPVFRWVIVIAYARVEYTTDKLMALIEEGTERGKEAASIVSGFDLNLPKTENKLGKRYQCLVCGTITLCTKAAQGSVHCHDQEMLLIQPRLLPSSD